MDEINSKLTASKKIVEKIEEHYELLSPLLQDRYEKELENFAVVFKKLKQYTANYEKQISEYRYESFEQYIDCVFSLFTSMDLYYDTIANIVARFNEEFLHADNVQTSDMSDTYKLKTTENLDKLVLEYRTFTHRYDTAEEKLISSINSQLHEGVFSNGSLLESALYIRSQFIKKPAAIKIYAAIIQDLVDGLVNDKPAMYKILELIEDDKNMVLEPVGQNIFSSNINKTIHVENPQLKRFGLIPNTDLMSKSQLVGLLNSQLGKKITASSWQDISKELETNVLLLVHCSFDTIEYNLRRLTLPGLSKQYKQPAEYGLNANMIEKFSVISQHDKNKKWDYRWQLYGVDGDNTPDDKTPDGKVYVVEQLSKDSYRLLSMWATDRIAPMTMARIKPLVKYLSSANKPDRVSCYHTAAIYKSTAGMFLTKPLDLDILETQSQDVDTQLIRNEIFASIKHIIDQIIDSDFKKGTLLHSSVDVNSIIHDARIREQFQIAVLKMYSVGVKQSGVNEFDAGKFPFHEVLSSFLVDLEAITCQFMKNLHDGYNRNPLAVDVFTHKNKLDAVEKKLEETINKVIGTILSTADNIYGSVNYKWLILNYY